MELAFLESMSPAQRKNWLVQYYSTRKRTWSATRKRQITTGELKFLEDLALVRRCILEPAVLADELAKAKAESEKRLAKLEKQGKIIIKDGKKFLKRSA